MDFYQSGRILSHSAVFMLLCVLLHHFFSVFCSYVNHLNMPFASSWHNVVLLELSTLFVKLRLIFVSFSHFSLNFCIVSFPFFAYNKLNTTFRTDSSLRETPERSFIIWNTAKNWSPWVSSPRCPAQRFTFWIKRSIPPPYGKTCSPRLKKRSFPGSSAIFFTQKKGTGTPMLLLHDLHCASSGREWQYIEDTLAKDHTVYTLDLLGCGRSDKPAITYTNFLYVQLIVTFIKQVIGCPTDVIASGLSVLSS